jgi:ribosomal protein S18 acetylase RimI-like enzyme
MEKSEINIKRISSKSLVKIEEHLNFDPNTFSKHKDRLGMQISGTCDYFIIYYKSIPVGHAFMKWTGIEKTVIPQKPEKCPDLEDLFVIPKLRSQGLGSLMIEYCIKLAREKGFKKIGLGVAIENVKAQKLYESFNFVDSGILPYKEIWYGKNKNGVKTGPFTSLNKYLILNI